MSSTAHPAAAPVRPLDSRRAPALGRAPAATSAAALQSPPHPATPISVCGGAAPERPPRCSVEPEQSQRQLRGGGRRRAPCPCPRTTQTLDNFFRLSFLLAAPLCAPAPGPLNAIPLRRAAGHFLALATPCPIYSSVSFAPSAPLFVPATDPIPAFASGCLGCVPPSYFPRKNNKHFMGGRPRPLSATTNAARASLFPCPVEFCSISHAPLNPPSCGMPHATPFPRQAASPRRALPSDAPGKPPASRHFIDRFSVRSRV